jgi:hypothetical protein
MMAPCFTEHLIREQLIEVEKVLLDSKSYAICWIEKTASSLGKII